MVFKLEFGSGLQPAMKRVDEGLFISAFPRLNTNIRISSDIVLDCRS